MTNRKCAAFNRPTIHTQTVIKSTQKSDSRHGTWFPISMKNLPKSLNSHHWRSFFVEEVITS
ncbi:MAG: hypothetical protein P8I93_02530 [Crocinitomicaceae bacterium]|nr:hypothetical protein [Crocinitomicaceae bacterium]